MNIYIYSDESGVFDKEHNDIFVFAGLIILGKDSREEWSRRYSKAENDLRQSLRAKNGEELKGSNLTNSQKLKLFRSLNNCYKFAAAVDQKKVLNNIFKSKKDKQRYLDYVYKTAVKSAFEKLIGKNIIDCQTASRLCFFVDEHTTATNGRYELKETLEQEFKLGTYNKDYSEFSPPLFSNLKDVELEYCNSKSRLLIRAADIVANRVFFLVQNDPAKLNEIKNLNLIYMP